MIKYLKRPESIVMHELTTSGIEQFITVIRYLRDNIDFTEVVLEFYFVLVNVGLYFM